MFEFVSPFDALAMEPSVPQAPAAPPVTSAASKKKPVPALNASASPSDESGLSAEERRNRDIKRQSVENLLGEQTRNLPPISQTQSSSQPLDSYTLPETFASPPVEQQARALPPKPSGPRNDSPKTSPRARNRQAVVDPNAPPPNTLATVQQSNRQRDGSPAPRRRAPGGKKAPSPTLVRYLCERSVFDR